MPVLPSKSEHLIVKLSRQKEIAMGILAINQFNIHANDGKTEPLARFSTKPAITINLNNSLLKVI